jgi:hypothetical protein
MLKKLKWQISGKPLAARYNWFQGPVPGRGPAVDKHCLRSRFVEVKTETAILRSYKNRRTHSSWSDLGFLHKNVTFCYSHTQHTNWTSQYPWRTYVLCPVSAPRGQSRKRSARISCIKYDLYTDLQISVKILIWINRRVSLLIFIVIAYRILNLTDPVLFCAAHF